MIELILPSEAHLQLLWAQYVALWIVLTYAFEAGPYGIEEVQKLTGNRRTKWKRNNRLKTLFAFLIALLLPGFSWNHIPARLLLGILVGVFTWATPRFRQTIIQSDRLKHMSPFVDATFTALFVLVSGVVVEQFQVITTSPVIAIPFSTNTLITVCLALSATFWLTGGATHVIRATLDQINAKPSKPSSGDDKQTDTVEYNRGRVIGNLERILLLIFALVGAYEAIALVIAVKGLVRWNRLDEPEFAEYFLIGNLLRTGAKITP